MKKILLFAFTLLLSISLLGCTSAEKVPKQADEASLKDYFPLTIGSTWQYKGDGNEYASFTRKVLFVEGDKAQISEDNGGTVSASVFKTTKEAITCIFSRGEEYDGVNLLNEESN